MVFLIFLGVLVLLGTLGTLENLSTPFLLSHSFYLGFQLFVFSFQLRVLRLQAFEQGILLLSVACSGSIHAFFDAALLHKQLL